LKLSLTVIGTPCSDPRAPLPIASSAAAASCNAASRRNSTTAFTAGLTASIRANNASVSSRDEISLRLTISAASAADRNSVSFTMAVSPRRLAVRLAPRSEWAWPH
jgi:hypothetical protein